MIRKAYSPAILLPNSSRRIYRSARGNQSERTQPACHPENVSHAIRFSGIPNNDRFWNAARRQPTCLAARPCYTDCRMPYHLPLLEGMTMNDSGPPKPKRRWYQFRLRTLVVALLVAGIGLGWLNSDSRVHARGIGCPGSR